MDSEAGEGGGLSGRRKPWRIRGKVSVTTRKEGRKVGNPRKSLSVPGQVCGRCVRPMTRLIKAGLGQVVTE